MKRGVLNSLAGISLLLLVTATALWLRSHLRLDAVSCHRSNPQLSIYSQHGRLRFCRTSMKPALRGWINWSSKALLGPQDPSHGWWLLGFDYYSFEQQAVGANHQVVILPYWFICLVTMLMPVRWLRLRAIALSRKRHALCWKCGYDLRASMDRCPECGTPIPPRAAAAGAGA